MAAPFIDELLELPSCFLQFSSGEADDFFV